MISSECMISSELTQIFQNWCFELLFSERRCAYEIVAIIYHSFVISWNSKVPSNLRSLFSCVFSTTHRGTHGRRLLKSPSELISLPMCSDSLTKLPELISIDFLHHHPCLEVFSLMKQLIIEETMMNRIKSCHCTKLFLWKTHWFEKKTNQNSDERRDRSRYDASSMMSEEFESIRHRSHCIQDKMKFFHDLIWTHSNLLTSVGPHMTSCRVESYFLDCHASQGHPWQSFIWNVLRMT